MRRIFVVMVSIVLAGVGIARPASANDTATIETKLVEAINAGRAKVGKGPLVVHRGLRDVARGHSRTMSQLGQLSHDGFSTRINTAAPDPWESNGAPDDGFGPACENVAVYGSWSSVTDAQVAQAIYDAWYRSTGHRQCMLDEYGYHFNVTGAGVYKDADGTFWATFESVKDTTPPPATAPEPSPAPAPKALSWTRVQESAATKSGSWGTAQADGSSGGSSIRSGSAGSSVTYTFTGTGVRWLGARSRYGGVTEVRLDGKLVATVDTYSPSFSYQQVLLERTALSSATHTLELRVTGKRQPRARYAYTDVDAFEYGR